MWTEQRLNSVLDPIRQGGGARQGGGTRPGGYRFAQLRHTPWDIATVGGGDIDLLTDEASVAALIRHLYDLALAGTCHFRVRRNSPDKTRITVYSPDMADRVELDLWVNLWQIDDGRAGLRFDDVRHLLSGEDTVQRLPIDVEAAVYLQHLMVKDKPLTSPTVQSRLSHYAAACRGSDLAGHVYSVLSAGQITPTVAGASLSLIQQRIGHPLRRRGMVARIGHKLRPFPTMIEGRVLAFIGCDGAGKTSVGESIARGMPQIEPVLAKQLYRQSLTFRGAYKLNKATMNKPSEWVDEKLAPLAFSRARKALIARLPRHRGPETNVLLLDRFLADFLYVGRKQAGSGFTPLARWCAGRSLQCSIVHFVLPFDLLSQRKQEVPQASQRAYDLAMLEYYTGAGRATDYLVYCNSGTVADATAAISEHLRERFRFRPSTPTVESTPSPREAAIKAEVAVRG